MRPALALAVTLKHPSSPSSSSSQCLPLAEMAVPSLSAPARSIDHLPDEVLVEILLRLDIPDLHALSLVHSLSMPQISLALT
jgi:hypothetical protein